MAKKENDFNISGRVVEGSTGEGVAGLRVEAWDQDLLVDDLVGSAVTDAQGAFQIAFDRSYFQELFLDRRPDLFFKVFKDGRLARSTEDSVLWNSDDDDEQEIVIAVAVASARAQEVKGTVRLADGSPAHGLRVSAFDRDLRSEQLLGQGESDREGFYRIQYLAGTARQRESGSADLVIKAATRDGSLLGASDILFNAPPLAEIDLTITAAAHRPPSLFEKIARALAPLLDGLKVEELEENAEHRDVSFLSGETGFGKSDLARFAIGHRLARQELEADAWFALLGGPVFEFDEQSTLAEQVETILDTLGGLDAEAVRKSLLHGLELNEIAEEFRARVPEWTEAFVRIAARRLIEPSDKPTFVKQALEDAGVRGEEAQLKFARLFNEHREVTPELLDALRKDRSFGEEAVNDLETSFRLKELTRGDFTVVRALKEDSGIRRPEEIRQLAKKSEDEWVELVKSKRAAGELNLPFEVGAAVEEQPSLQFPEEEAYGKSLEREFREAFPTAAFTGGLERALQGNGARGLGRAEELGRFLDSHASFELLNTPVEEFLKNGLDPEFRELASDEAFVTELKAVQRVFKLAPTFEATDALLADGVHSAQQVYRLGESRFVRNYAGREGFTDESARVAWNRAADTHAAVLTLVSDLRALQPEGLPQVLLNGNEALANFPNWENLFQTGDLCECEHCRSVLGPAAYFADLLLFLEDRGVRDVLFNRRLDLGYLELNCENALTPIPYIDVVCEVLEDVIAEGANDRELVGLTNIADDSDATKATVAGALAAAGLPLSEEFSLSQVDPADADLWVAHGEDATYLFKKKATPNFFAEILRNTKASAAELRAYPQYVNPAAYARLRAARYPSALPFDLFAEEVRAAMQKTNLQRWDLMLTLRGAAPPNNPTDGDIAAEYFGISSDPSAALDEKQLIIDPDATLGEQRETWGETGNAAWLDAVSNVKTFLQKTSLTYEELLALLDLGFINPDGDLFIEHLDPSCDTEQKVIRGLDQPGQATLDALDRIHRFLRLWRKLKGWKMWEVDLAIRHPRVGNGAIDEPALINLFYFGRVRDRLGRKATVEQVLALFGNLNTETFFTELHEPRADGLYQQLFLNKRLIRPLDPAFEVAAVDVPAPTLEKIPDHRSVLLAALGIRESDLVLLETLTDTTGAPYITDDLTLTNLSFLWRHAWLAKQLKFKADEWKTLLKLFDEDIAEFADPQAAFEFLERIDQLKATGFKPDELNWLLAADRMAKAAVKEAEAARFLAALRKELQAIRDDNDPAQFDFLNVLPPTDVESLSALLTSLLQRLNRDEAQAQFFISTLADEASQERTVAGLPAGFDFPLAISSAIRIRYDEPTTTLRFTGLMTAAERTTLLTDASLAAVTVLPAYQQAIEDLFSRPRLALRFFEPVFTAPLPELPTAVDFGALADAALARKISYDGEQRLLRFAGIMSLDERAALDALSADADYRNAVDSLAAQPAAPGLPPEIIWLEDADLAFPLRDLADPTNDNLAVNLATAVTEALAYLSRTLRENAVVQQTAEQLGLTPAVARLLLTRYALLPQTLLEHLTGPFVATSGVVDYATLKSTFDGWFWLKRVAVLLTKWKLTLEELERLVSLTGAAQLLDFPTLPLDDLAGDVAPFEEFLRTARLLRLRDGLPETGITLLEVLVKLDAGASATPADFAADAELLNEDWPAADVERLVASLDLLFAADYLLAETWERLRRAFYFLDSLNAGADTAATFAAAAMTEQHAKTLKELLRSKFGAETWLELSAEIQDVLRERKRDALAAFRLTQPQPPDAPTGKWENTNDLYAYYLLDVEMSACQLTSRLVQASGSVQLFVQRCFMGLEPDVLVKADGPDGDSAWRWWKWMRKYRVWEANRKVFLWPENWIEPELRRDKSQFFADLENELLQNEVNQYTVETAFQNYLEKLDDVAQLELAGFYQEDDGDETIVHVFGRTTGIEPHRYYYRRFDYRQWTPWETVELEIEGDYLIPAVVNKRLFLFWPVFKEVPDEYMNSKVRVPDLKEANAPVPPTWKRLQIRMAVSDYRQGKWTPKKVSTDFNESGAYTTEIVKKHYRFFPVDRSGIDDRFGIKYDGHSIGSDDQTYASLNGAFEIAGCKGVPVKTNNLPGLFYHVLRPEQVATGNQTEFLKWVEQLSRTDTPQDFALESLFAQQGRNVSAVSILTYTPGIFKMTPAWHLSYLDRLLLDGMTLFAQSFERMPVAVGSWLPYFYNDRRRTFFVLPTLLDSRRRPRGEEDASGSVRRYYPDVKRFFRAAEGFFEKLFEDFLAGIDFEAMPAATQQAQAQFLFWHFPEVSPPPYTNAQFRELWKRFLMRIIHLQLGALSAQLFQLRRFHFKNFYHPFVCDFAKLVYNPLKGIPGLMSRETQLKNSGFSFKQTYGPTPQVVENGTEKFYPKEDVDFLPDGAYSSYNWELFFHAPLLIANSLSRNQRFEEAREWYHFIFNPVGVEGSVPGGSPMSKFWLTKPFFETTDPQYVQQRIDNILRLLAGDTTAEGFSGEAQKALEGQVRDWRTNPFEPHRIANYRTVAYQKTVVMKYLDNLIEWGDYLFRQDSMESINEATQLYILAAEILGPRPRNIPPQARPPVRSYNELAQELDAFANALVEVENLVPPQPGNAPDGGDPAPLPLLYFCIPHNEKLLGYWDKVADRLYKIRHCMNIEGVVRQLALFEPPIDPAALVKAVAGGMDIGAALADLNAPLPLYRFNVMLQKANEVCGDVKALGGALLAALEKKDAEALGLLRQSQEIKLLEAAKAVRKQQIDEAKEQLNGIHKSKALTELRRDYYRDIERISKQEQLHLDKTIEANTLNAVAQGVKLGASVISYLPDINIGASGFGGSPIATFKIGGLNLGQAASIAADVLTFIAQIAANDAAMAAAKGGFDRRWEEWKLQERLAEREIAQLDSQIAAAELRVALAEKELANHELQIENAKATDAYMRTKFTNEALYQWQVGQISGVYFQSYRLAYDLAKRAEKSFRFELGLPDSGFINFGYWDSLKKGLLAGEKLQYDLRRLETAYMEKNRREFELTKHVSLETLDPLALVRLRETGRCFFRLPEEIFDLDYPGHYFRRIKSVSLTLPCVVGPYTTISCTLRLLKNSVRINTAEGEDGYPRNVDDQGLPADDTRFVENNIPVKAIAAGGAQNDSGMFELSFRDERYLPFEGAGAISEWALELFNDPAANNPDPGNPDFGKALRQFDYSTISDAVVHIKYTAREDAGPFKNRAVTHLRDHFSQDGETPSLRLFDLRRDFPGQWHRFLHPTGPADPNVFELELSPALFPFKDTGKTLKVNRIWLLARCDDPGSYEVLMVPPLPSPPPTPGDDTLTLTRLDAFGGLHVSQRDVSALGIELELAAPPVTWQLTMTRPGGNNLQEDPSTQEMEVHDVLLVLGYEWE